MDPVGPCLHCMVIMSQNTIPTQMMTKMNEKMYYWHILETGKLHLKDRAEYMLKLLCVPKKRTQFRSKIFLEAFFSKLFLTEESCFPIARQHLPGCWQSEEAGACAKQLKMIIVVS